MDLKITPVNGSAAVAFPYDPGVKDALKAAFPKARWNKESSSWIVPGAEAVDAVSAWWSKEGPLLQSAREARRQQDKVARDSFKEFAAHEREAMVAEARANPIVSEHVRLSDDASRWVVATPYDKEILEILKSIVGATYMRRENHWTVPLLSTETLRQAAPDIDALAAKANALAAKANRTASRTLEGVVVSADAPRFLVAVAEAPELGQPVVHADAAIVPLRLGTVFKTSTRTLKDNPDCDVKAGDEARYVYYRDATPEEAEKLSETLAPKGP